MTEKEKCQQGLFYDANYDPELLAERQACCEALYDFNALRPSQEAERKELLRKILGATRNNLTIVSPFFCDYGYNVEVGENFFANTNCVILDEAKVKFGDNVFIGQTAASTLPNILSTLSVATKVLRRRHPSRLATTYGLEAT